MRTFFFVLFSFTVALPFASGQELGGGDPPLADSETNGGNRECKDPSGSGNCFKNETGRKLTEDPPAKVVNKVDKFSGTQTVPADAKPGPQTSPTK